MGIIKQRRIKRERKKAREAAQRHEARVWRNNGYSYEEISDRMNLKESTVRRLLKEK